MVRYIFITIAAFFIISCSSEPSYKIEEMSYVPDSLRDEQRAFVIELTSAASEHMSAGDYEEVYETIREAERVSEELFSVKIEGLVIMDRRGWDRKFPWQFSVREKFIFNELKKE